MDQIIGALDHIDPQDWANKMEAELVDIANSIADGAESLYNKYGAPAINALSDGINAIGDTFKNIGNAIGSALTVQ